MRQSTLDDYQTRAEDIVKILGSASLVANLGPADFENLRKKLAERFGLVRLAGHIVVAKMLVLHAQRCHHITVDMGPNFARPSAKSLREERFQQPPRYFKPKEFRKVLKAAKQPLRTMLLFAMNCGFSNADCAALRLQDVNLDSPLLNFMRPKTAMPRMCYLWPITRKALREAIAQRPEAAKPEDGDLVFITKYGNSFKRTKKRGCQIAKETLKLLKQTGLHRKNLNFGALRHTFLSVAEDACAKGDVDLCMGHRTERRDPEIEVAVGSAPRPSDMSANYRESRREAALKNRLKRLARSVYDYAFTRRSRAGNPCPPTAADGAAVILSLPGVAARRGEAGIASILPRRSSSEGDQGPASRPR